MKISKVGDGKVVLIAGGGKIYTDIAARFVKSEKSLDEIIMSDYDKNIVKNILDAGHLAATEFDNFIFGIEGFARVCEIQLVRKRLASYIIKSGKYDKNGKRSYDVAIPESLFNSEISFNYEYMMFDTFDLLKMMEAWYNEAIKVIPEEEARYLKPQATEFKAIFSMNCHSLLDWFKIRCCQNACPEIKNLANKMLKLCKEAAPDLFEKAGSNCKVLGYCPENRLQHKNCKGKVITHTETLEAIELYKNMDSNGMFKQQ